MSEAILAGPAAATGNAVALNDPAHEVTCMSPSSASNRTIGTFDDDGPASVALPAKSPAGFRGEAGEAF
jgi:hypothetical protein